MTFLTRRQILAVPAAASLARLLDAATLERIPLGVTTDEIDEDVLTAVRFLQKFGLKYAEVRSIWGKYNTAHPIEKVREAQELFREHGIRVSVESTAFFKIPLPPDNAEGQRVLDEQWKLLDTGMERAKVFGTDKLRTFAFTGKGREPLDRKNLPRIYELVGEAARRAKAKNFRLALENVGGSYVQTGVEAGELLKNVKEDALGLTWDPNNAGSGGEKAFPDGYRALDPKRIFHVHLRDYQYKDGKSQWTAVGEGEFDNLGQLRALLKDGYRGSFTLETHWQGPNGKAASTETSLKALLKIIEQV
jgi:L-ribulose-5-phosphate 3-epimerase